MMVKNYVAPQVLSAMLVFTTQHEQYHTPIRPSYQVDEHLPPCCLGKDNDLFLKSITWDSLLAESGLDGSHGISSAIK